MSASKYKPEYCEKLVEHMKRGFSYETFGTEIRCGRSTMYEWEALHEDWATAKRRAIEEAQKFFESRLIAKIAGQDLPGFDSRKVDTACLIFALKTRFHKTYGEKKDVKVEGIIGITIDDDDSGL